MASSRSNAGGGDPSDAMRAVNSLLTSLDRLRAFPNVLLLATTNLTGSVDAAFVDRVDLKIHIGLPILRARYEILRSCMDELIFRGIIAVGPDANCGDNVVFVDFSVAEKEERESIDGDESGIALSKILLSCAKQSDGLSGRSLRRLPLQAHTQFISSRSIGMGISARSFLGAF